MQDSLPNKDMVNIYALTMKKRQAPEALPEPREERGNRRRGRSSDRGRNKNEAILDEWESAVKDGNQRFDDLAASTAQSNQALSLVESNRAGLGDQGRRDEADVMALMEQVACMRDGNRTATVVAVLVQHIVRAWRLSFAQAVAMKFNCFFLMPFLEEFPFYLRERMDAMYNEELKYLFDLSEASAMLKNKVTPALLFHTVYGLDRGRLSFWLCARESSRAWGFKAPLLKPINRCPPCPAGRS